MELINKYIKGDRAVWMITLLLALASMLLVYSSIVTLAYKHYEGNTLRYLFRHGFFLLSGFVIIFITHNKITMEAANHLMGVTMHEPGVSRLVTVDIEEAAQLAAS